MSGATRNLRDGAIFIEDGSAIPKIFEALLTEGDLAFTEKDQSFIVMDRGRIDSRKQGDESVLDINFTAKFQQWSGAYGDTGLSLIDVLTGSARARAAGYVSTDQCGPWAVTVKFRVVDPCNKANAEVFTFSNVHISERAFKEGSEYNTVAVKGDALQGTVVATYETP